MTKAFFMFTNRVRTEGTNLFIHVTGTGVHGAAKFVQLH